MSDASSAALPTGLRPFVPAADFEKSKRFYEGLGFSIEFEDGRVAVMCDGQAHFILQNFHEKGLAENLMLQLVVPDAEAWWAERQPEQLAQTFGLRDPQPPAMPPWGRKVSYITDPSGVLWHIAELG
ncbi:VOC family protein [Methylobacterium sp. Leaf123]|uniref:VOC family protein n=1 Tax=Methylobacterium sp. Leaf123 TaxID=1736264 RepID=UPI0009E94253|nr:VOC family protein [Methylobacterium sp. Leaf123]